MQFTLTGFSQDAGFRVFAFDGTGEDRVRIGFTVRADLALARKYGIRIQELALMCRGLLEHRDTAEEIRTLTFTEDQMCLHAQKCVAARAAAAQKRKPPRRPHNDNIGAGWRVPPPR